ncbi:hypothetical protein BU24DRAFT_419944 [Aaosphaeria arxii CBS 175.79]|uniref:Uncharacterized protein n=1 Tax=Aaosphaeria arxii CBS 175.79 TaxID=1450172 RepID=A0A6A5XVP7_9PLEO|nr:uncharacterized protein BU24DRAFT_419944 [Aaosphaeria arxii CBS 175.79]KAF2016897.1 hypothetical protein BU24DRAFT_419944 [Aaosphaeria arxii CBS 175.79]
MFQSLLRLLGRAPKNTLPPFDFKRNRYPAIKKWPPNLRELTEKQQFRFERKFKRRLRLKSIKPTWNKWVKIVQWSLIGGVTVYAVFFYDFRKDPMNPRPGEQPFDWLRAWTREKLGGVWSVGSGSSTIGERGQRRVLEEELEVRKEGDVLPAGYEEAVGKRRGT